MGCHVQQADQSRSSRTTIIAATTSSTSSTSSRRRRRRSALASVLFVLLNCHIYIQPTQSYLNRHCQAIHRNSLHQTTSPLYFNALTLSAPCSSRRITTTATKLLAKSTDKESESDQASSIKTTTTITTATNAATATNTTPTSVIQRQVVEGIGGEGGHVYNVNLLKRNLLQETMSAYKEELFELLSRSTPTDEAEIVEQLSSLVQASPVRTTTDSNLLDGADDWVLAYRSHYPTTVSSLILYDGDGSGSGPKYNARYNFLFRSRSMDETSSEYDAGGVTARTRASKQRSSGNVVWNKITEFCQTKQRSFKLENLAEDEDSYILDTTAIFGGIVTKTKVYALEGLTRSSLSMHKESTRWSVLVGPLAPKQTALAESRKDNSKDNTNDNIKASTGKNKGKGNTGKSKNKSFSVQIIYLDNDFCILTEEDGPDSPFMVYTRNKAYLDIFKSMQRKLKLLQMGVWGLVSIPLNSVRNMGRRQRSDAAAKDPILNAAKLRVLRLGDVNGEDEDESWESESDPFVHLSADERQRLLKAMSVEEVEQAADTYRNSKMRFRFIRKLLGRRKKYFKKPPEKWRRPK